MSIHLIYSDRITYMYTLHRRNNMSKFHEQFRTLGRGLKIVNFQKISAKDGQLLKIKSEKVQEICINCSGILKFQRTIAQLFLS